MSTKIGIISDTHSTTAPLKEALSIFAQQRVDHVICAGDIAGYGEDELEQTIELLEQNDCLMISGNHDHWEDRETPGNASLKIKNFFESLPTHLALTVEGKSIYVAHASPPDAQHGGIKLLDPDGNIFPERKQQWTRTLAGFEHDILIVGHTHQIFNEKLGDVLVINPGSTTFNHNCSILTLPEMQVENYPLSNKAPLKVWNWGMFHRGL